MDAFLQDDSLNSGDTYSGLDEQIAMYTDRKLHLGQQIFSRRDMYRILLNYQSFYKLVERPEG